MTQVNFTSMPFDGFLKKLRKNGLFANLKKCQFYKTKIYFVRYVVLAQRVQMEDKKIEEVKNWPKPKSMYNI